MCILFRKSMFSHGLGQQATFADAPRVFVLNVRNWEGNPAAGGHELTVACLN
jgi:hypothetical protein